MQAKVRDVMFKVATTVVCLLAYGMSSRLERVTVRPSYYYDPQEDLYGLAAKTISRSSMWSSDKAKALNVLLSDAPDGYYHSIISIVNSGMWSSDILASIKRESAKFADYVQI